MMLFKKNTVHFLLIPHPNLPDLPHNPKTNLKPKLNHKLNHKFTPLP